MDTFLIFLIVILIVIVIGMAATIHEYLQRKRILKELKHLFSEFFNEGTAIPVRYASKNYWHGWGRGRLPWEGVGYIVIGPSWILLIGKLIKADNIEQIRMPIQEITIKWSGQRIYMVSLIAWFGIRFGNSKYYFTSFGGMSTLRSEESTREIFDEIVRRMKILNMQ